DNVTASSGGGSILLNGYILSTNTLGNIHVNGGFGKINIDNQSGYALKVQDINAGDGALLAGNTGKVEIRDTSPTAPSHVLYTYTPEAGVQEFRGSLSDTADQLVKVTGVGGNVSASYQPTLNARWEWTERATLSRNITFPGATTNASNWKFDGNVNDPWTMVNSGVVIQADKKVFEEVITGKNLHETTRWFGYGGCDKRGQSNCNYGFLQTSDDTNPPRGWWEYRYVDRAQLDITSSVKADNAIKIDFSGNATGSVSIKSNTSVQLAGQIINPSGTTTITTGAALTQGVRGSLSTQDLTLSAGQGIGTAQKAISATLGTNGVLNAASGAEGIHLDLASGATIGTVKAGTQQGGLGDVQIAATNSLLAQNTGATNITGNNITLTSSRGAVGGDGAPMVISAIGNSGVNGALGGVVNVQAHENIDLRQVGGDLLVGQIASNGNGNVSIDVRNGTIYDARGQTAANTLSEAQVKQVWTTLKLTEKLGAETGKATDASVVAFEQQVQRDYQKLLDLRGRGAIDATGALVLDAVNIALLRPLAAGANGSATDAQVAAYANREYQAANDALVAAAGADWKQLVAGNKLRFAASTEQIARLTENAIWTESELSYSLNRTALEPTPTQQVGDATANIVGRTITIDTSAAIGKLAPSVAVSLQDLSNGTLTNTQKAALGMAKAPGDIKLTGTAANGATVTYDFDPTRNDVALTGFLLAQTSPLFIDATGAINVNARGGAIYVQGTGVNRDLHIGHVTATGAVNLTAPQSIVVATDTGNVALKPVQIVAGGDVRLTAGSGNLGTAVNPLTYQTNGVLQLATAGQSIFLEKPVGDMRLGGVAGGGVVRLEASTGSILVNNQNSGLTVRGHDVALIAAKDLGTASNALRVSTGNAAINGKLDGTAGGNAWLTSPNAGDTMTIGTLTVGGNLGLVATGDLVLGQVTSHGGVTTVSGGATRVTGSIAADDAVTMEATTVALDAGSSIAAGGNVAITASTGDAVLANVSGADVAIAAAGRILAAQSGQNVLAHGIYGQGGTATLDSSGAVGGIGDSGALGVAGVALGVSADYLTAKSANGAIALELWRDTRAAWIDSAHGVVQVAAHGALDASHIAGSAVTLAVAGDLSATSATATASDLAIDAGGEVRVDRLAAVGTARVQSGTALDVGALTAGGDTNIAAGGTANLGTVNVGNVDHQSSLTVTSGDMLTIHEANVTGAVAVQAAAADLGRLNAGMDLTVGTVGNAKLVQAYAGGHADVHASAANIDSLTARGDARLTTTQGNLMLEVLEAGSLTAIANGDLALTQATVHGAADVSATGNISAAQFAADGATTMQAGAMLAIDHLTAGGDTRLAAGSDATFGTINVGNAAAPSSLAAISGGMLTIDQADATGAMTLAAAAADLHTLNTGLDLAVVVAANTALVQATVGRAIDVQAGSASIGLLTAGGDARLASTQGNLAVGTLDANTLRATANGDLALQQATVRGVAIVTASGNISAGQFAAAGMTTMVADSALSIDHLAAGGNANLQAGMAADIGNMTVDGNAGVQTGTTLSIDHLAAGGNANVVTGTALAINNLTVGGNAYAASGTALAINDLTVSGNTDVATGSTLNLGNLTVGGATSMDAGTALAVDRITAVGDTRLAVGTTATLGTVNVGNIATPSALAVTSGDLLTIGQADATGIMTLQAAAADLGTLNAGLDLTVATAGNTALAQANAGGLADLHAGSATIGHLTAHGDARLTTTQGNLAVGTLDASTLAATVTGNLALTQTTVHGAADVKATGNIVAGQFGADGATAMQADNALTIDTLIVGGDASLQAGATATLGTVNVGNAATQSSLAVTSGDLLTIGQADATGIMTLQAAAADLGTLNAGLDLTVATAGNTALAQANAGGLADLHAGSATIGHLTAHGDARLATTQGNLAVGTLDASTLAATVNGDLALTQATVHGAADVKATSNVVAGQFAADGATAMQADNALTIDTLTIGGDASLQAGATATLGTVNVGNAATLSSLAVTSGDLLTIGQADATGIMTLQAAAADLGTLSAGLDLTVATAGNTALAQANAGGFADLYAGSATIGHLTAHGDARLTTTQGNLAVGTLDASTLAATVTGDLALTQATVHGAADVKATGNIVAGQFAADGALAMQADNALTIDTLTIGGDASVHAGMAADIDSLVVGGNARVTTGSTLGIRDLSLGGNANMQAGSALAINSATVGGDASMGAGSTLAIDQLTAVGRTSLQAGTTATLGTVNVGTAATRSSLTVTSGGAQAIGQLGASGDISLRGSALVLAQAQAGRDIQVVMQDSARVNGVALRARSVAAAATNAAPGGDIAIGALVSGGVTSIQARGALDVTTLTAVGGASLDAGANATFGTMTVGDAGHAADLVVNAGGTVSARVVEGARDVLLHGAALTLGAATAAHDLALQADAGDASYNRLGAGRDVTAMAAGNLTGASGSVLTSARDVRLSAGSFIFDQASAGRNIAIDPVGNVTGNALQAGANVLVRSSGSIGVGSMRAIDTIDLSADKGIQAGTLRAASLNASTAGNLTMDVVVDAGKLTVGAGSVAINVRSGTPQLVFDMTGYRGGVADSAVVTIDGAASTAFPRFMAKNATLTTNADVNTFASAYITGTMLFTNPSGMMYMNNVNAASVPGSLLQLLQPTYGFQLEQDGLYYATNAYATQYAPQYRPIAINHQQSRIDSAILALGASAARVIGTTNERLRNGASLEARPVTGRPTAEPQPQIAPDHGAPAVNWGDEVTAGVAQGVAQGVATYAIELVTNNHALQP
ncbi:MAG: hypothetical protein ABW069_09875, partial [Duganella sp.]